MLDRDKLIAEVYGLAALVATREPEEQAESYISGATIARADGGQMLRRAVFQISEDGCVEVIEEEVIGEIPRVQ